jgi:hypothetical protein
MPERHTRPEPWLLPIRRPGCPKCEGRMILAATAPGPEGLELRTFECRECDHSFTNAVAKDPMNTVSAGWIAGELKAPM